MPRVVEIQYDPYIPQMSILIDGASPPQFSRLIQYSDEDIWIWINEVFDTLYSEVRDEFFVIFTGTKQDADIVRFVCEKTEYCKGFRYKEFPVSDGLTKRMGKLNQLIKRTGMTVYQKSVIDAFFYIGTSFQKFGEDIFSLDINNLFCSVRVHMMGEKSGYVDRAKSVLLLLEDSVEEGKKRLQCLNVDKPVFVLTLGDERRVLDVCESGWFIQTTEQELFDTVFDCFLQMPLLIAFRDCIKSIRGGNKISKEVRLITCIEPLVIVTVGNEVEVGKSIRVVTELEPRIGEIPDLVFRVRQERIARCDGLAVYGLNEGSCTLEVFKQGSSQPFFTKTIKVYKRNRITSLLLSEDSVILGMNDRRRLQLNYFPVDADNVNTISWKSSDEKIAAIDNNGNITATGIGSCRLICTAENVAAQCLCTVKPYLADIETDLQLDENAALTMLPLQEVTMSIRCVPEDSFDGIITLESSDSDVVNVVNSTLYSKNTGNATITMRNNTSRICRSFTVKVSKNKPKKESKNEPPKEPKKKQGFFKSLFKKGGDT